MITLHYQNKILGDMINMKIIIGADLVPTKTNEEMFVNGDVESLIGKELCEILKSADFTVFNLEVPLTDSVCPIKKQGPALYAPMKTILGIKKINPHFFTLANNHILDQGEKGLIDTISLLKEHGINYAGIGENIKDAAKPFIFEFDKRKVGFYCCTEHEFSAVNDEKIGANVYDSYRSNIEISNLSSMCDYLIVLYHGGKEQYRYPAPYLRDECRKMIDSGANLVICQHSHCIGCEEYWKDGHIIYGQGNFLFDANSNEYWDTGLLIDLEIGNGILVNYIPIVKDNNKIKLADTDKASLIIGEFKKRSKEIIINGYIEAKYEELSIKQLDNYLLTFQGKVSKKIWFRALNKLSGYKFGKWYVSRYYDEQSLLTVLNYLQCETHRDLIIQGIEKRVE